MTGQARAGVTYSIEETGPEESRVTLAGTIKLTGALANLGRNAVTVVADRQADPVPDQFGAEFHCLSRYPNVISWDRSALAPELGGNS